MPLSSVGHRQTQGGMIRHRIDIEADRQRLYALCGTRLYAIQTLTGAFPDVGWHQPGEMGGIWSPPLKLLDGYWLALARPGAPPIWLTTPETWQFGPDGATFTYRLPDLGLRVTSQAWIVPDQAALVLDLTLAADETRASAYAYVGPIECGVLLRSDLHGPWLSDRAGWPDGADIATYDHRLRAAVFVNSANPAWAACAGAAEAPAHFIYGPDVFGPERPAGQGSGAALWYARTLDGQHPAHLRLVLCGSARPEDSATALLARLLATAASQPGGVSPLDAAHRQARRRYLEPFETCVLESPDPLLDEAFGWAKANITWLQLDVPGQGSAPMGGLPDYPWWFGCDISYTVPPMLAAGEGRQAAEALRTLAAISQRTTDRPGAVIHEAVPNGMASEVSNLVEVPLFTCALYHTYRWTGDRTLLDDLLPFCRDGLLNWALGSALQPGEVVPQGRSMIETPDMHGGVQVLDVAGYLAEALEMLADLAVEQGALDLAPESLRERAAAIRAHVRDEWWLPDEGLYGDMRASRAEMAALLARFEATADGDESVALSITRLRAALAADHAPVSDDQRRPWFLHNYVQALAAEAGLPTQAQAERLLSRMETPEWSEDYGVVLNAATDRRIMSLPTGALACAEARYGRPEAALEHVRRICTALGRATPGTIAEFSPDGGNFLQSWSGYGVVWPLVRYIFGIHPDVAHRRVTIIPNIPASWPHARLRAVPLGTNRVDISMTSDGETLRVVTESAEPGWAIALGAVAPSPTSQPMEATRDGQPVRLRRVTDDHGEQRAAWVAEPAPAAHNTTELLVRWSTAMAEARPRDTSSDWRATEHGNRRE